LKQQLPVPVFVESTLPFNMIEILMIMIEDVALFSWNC